MPINLNDMIIGEKVRVGLDLGFFSDDPSLELALIGDRELRIEKIEFLDHGSSAEIMKASDTKFVITNTIGNVNLYEKGEKLWTKKYI